jgi:CIC family chloride channel protein
MARAPANIGRWLGKDTARGTTWTVPAPPDNSVGGGSAIPHGPRKGRQARTILVLAAAVGLVTGLGVTLFEWVAREQVFGSLSHRDHWVQVVAPVIGLLLAAGALRWLAHGASSATADEYIANFHQPDRLLDQRPVLGRLVASLATLGLGGAMGYEGPSIYLGAAFGSLLQRRLGHLVARDDTKVLLVAGAAAGVAAIFKAPATGLVFALEVPYQEDFARRMLLPAGIAAAVSYLTFVSFRGTAPLLAVQGSAPFNLRDLGGAVVLGLLCGLGARAFVSALGWAKHAAERFRPMSRAFAAGAVLAGLAAAAFGLTGKGLTLGAGYDTLQWALDPRRSVAIVTALLVMRGLATVTTVAGGGVGGLFIPLVIEGALLGRAVGGLFGTAASGSTLFPLIGAAAFLGAGYQVPLAGVMFIAESTGRPGFVVPGLIAALVAQLFMGNVSASSYQVATRDAIMPTEDD